MHAMTLALLASIVGLAVLALLIRRSLRGAPTLPALTSSTGPEQPSLSVIVPAFDEEANIAACVRAILAAAPRAGKLELIVVDDRSRDRTWQVLQALERELADKRLILVAGAERPTDRRWVGKNWACAQGYARARGEYLLFVDADVRLKPGAIERALTAAHAEKLDLLTLAPEVVCGCAAEWVVQPTMVGLISVRFDFERVNSAKSAHAFACGPFMLFSRAGYDAVGGHGAVAGEVVEDVVLARRLKALRRRLSLRLGHDIAAVRMYQSFAALWEGWTKGLYFAHNRNPVSTVASAFAAALLFPLPWIGLATGAISQSAWLVGLAAAAIALQVAIRALLRRYLGMPMRGWWLSGAGGALIALMALASIINWETGWGWTWRGRSLRVRATKEPLIVRLTPRPWFRRAVYSLLRKRASDIVDDIEAWFSTRDRILDIGAGTCNVYEILTERGHQVLPVDVKPMSIVPGVTPRLYDGRNLPFADRSFDLGLLVTVLHHAEDPDRVVAEAARVSRRLIIMEDLVYGPLHRRWTHFLDSLTNLEFAGHPHSNKTDQEWRALFTRLRLRPLEVRYHQSPGGMRHATYHLVHEDLIATQMFEAPSAPPLS